MQTIKLNLIPGSVLPVVNVSQYDKSRQFALQVYEGAASYSLTGKSVQIRGTKPDGNGFAYDSTDGVVSVSGNTATISTTQQMTAVGGQTMAELRIKSGTTILGTINFILDVEHSALSDDTPISETEIPAIERDFEAALEEAQAAAETATTKAGEAATSATSAATSATNAGNSATTASNAATTATTKAGEASTSATTASTAATSAAADSLEAEGWAVGEQGGQPVGPTSPYYQNNAAYYAAQAGQYATGGLIFKGSVAFANIPTTGMVNGDMYNITDDFTTDSRFIEGAGVSVKAGTDIAWVGGNTNKWNVLATGGGGADALDDLTDVDLTTPVSGELLQYDGAKWKNAQFEIGINAGDALFIGDSYSDGPSELVQQVLSNLSSVFDKTAYVLATGGHGFTGKDGTSAFSTTLMWKTDLEGFVGSHTSDELAAIKNVYIIGGFNDIYSSYNNIVSYINTFFTYARGVLPNAQFHVGMCGWCDATVNTITTPNITNFSVDEVRYKLSNMVSAAYRDGSIDNGASYIGDLYLGLHNYGVDFDSTYYHPSAAGYKTLARLVSNYIIDGTFSPFFGETEEVFNIGGVNKSIFAARLNGDTITITNRVGNGFTITPSANVSANTVYFTNYTLVSGLVGGKNYGFGNTTYNGIIYDGSTYEPCFLQIAGNLLGVLVNKPLTANTTYTVYARFMTILACDC